MPGLILSAIALGLVFSATPGAVNAESLRRGAAHGFAPALLVQLGSLTGDMVWAGVALTGTAFLVQNRPIALVLGIVGACFLLRQAYSAFQAALRGTDMGQEAPSGRGNFITGAFFSLTNPFAVAFWLGLGAGVAASAHAGATSAALFFAGFFLGAVLWCIAFATAVSVGRRYITGRVLRILDAIAGAALSVFGLRLLLQTLKALRILRVARALVG